MAKNLEAFRPFVPVDMLTRDPVRRDPEPVKEEPGACWGRPSPFAYSAQGRHGGDGSGRPGLRAILPPDDPKIYKRVLSANLQTNRSAVRVLHPDDPARYLEVLRMAVLSFAYTELREKKRPGLQPKRHSSWHLSFDLHPPNEAQ